LFLSRGAFLDLFLPLSVLSILHLIRFSAKEIFVRFLFFLSQLFSFFRCLNPYSLSTDFKLCQFIKAQDFFA